ncbi:RecQ family ATP-dependent DNA helicase [Paludibacter sp.]|uniref:RecQ family ATP-dependent DNA helicase n=1 Tax=Paludibacter sp. TaxID=1898105 RepID=UPI0013536A1D|nr:RecQ family ATP-dependent DNA helicase [Paludibacter sp.]MTK53099.1 RecQ family ATP-dependent DNA helicase [Paludibacter sp.]
MHTIAFIDTEVDPKTSKVLDIGSIRSDGNVFHKASLAEFVPFLQGTEYVCGHNILSHDLKYIGPTLKQPGLQLVGVIDTLYLSPLLFPTKPYHALLKDDKLQTEEMNNPLNDSIKARDLFYDEVSAFMRMDETLKQLLYLLLWDKREFRSFFRFIGYKSTSQSADTLIRSLFANEICAHANIATLIEQRPVELAYCLALIHSFAYNKNIHSITPPWVLKNFPEVERIMLGLRSKPCISGCAYCNTALDIHKGLKRFFGFDAYRTYGGEPLQEKAVKAALDNKSLLAIFPTGGGKSITFQVPALMSGESTNGLTIVISPLQSLMKDQVDNLEKNGITEAVTINGLLDPIERAKSFERVEDGSASILYISPESLRSKSIERLLLGRKIVRFVIDEAHCFSAWGQDFRVDYLYIGDFIRQIQEKKNLEDGIPVSCFTATAKQKVIEDILQYFREKLSIDLEVFSSKASRTNLTYKVFERNDDEEKYQTVRDLIEEKNCPTIIYVSRTRKAFSLAERLANDGFSARSYHGKMDAQEKTANQNAFIEGDVQIMVATSAFGMGVDKKNVGMVIHFEISDSLENYIQEAGRAGRDEKIVADCFVLFNEEDLSKHFILLNQSKLSIREIQQIWKAIKDITRFRSHVSNSALEIARKAGWDENVAEIETRVTTAIAALEDAGYLKRGQNMPRVFANSILCKNAQEAIEKINHSKKFHESQKQKGVRIIKKLIASKSHKQNPDDEAETRVDYISDDLGILREEVINIITLLREENILADAKDLTAYIKRSEQINRSLSIVDSYGKIEKFLLAQIEEQEKTFNLKALNEEAEAEGCKDISINKIKTILNFWSIKNWVKRQNLEYTRNHLAVISLHPIDVLRNKLEKRRELARFIVEFLYEKCSRISTEEALTKEELLVEFSVLELKQAYESGMSLFKLNIELADVEDVLFYLSRIEAIKIEGGFLVTYNRLTIDRLEQDNRKKYTKDDYEKLNQFYENKVQQIHIVGEYAKKMIDDYRSALQFVDDYFQLNYGSFLNRYFPGSKADTLKLKMTPAKFRQLFGELSPTQLSIINDNESKYIAVVAGPGSGKTRVLVHKLASLLLMEDVKHEQLLMLTFSRAAVSEFKKRLYKLIGNAAYFIEIKTFHSYCFDLLGKVGSLEKSDDILKKTIEKIRNNEVEISHITKTVLVIDEAQDMNEDEYNLVNALMELNEEMRVIAVGDDDQNIFEFRGSSSKYMEDLILTNNAAKHELIENYRSKNNLVEYTNEFSKQIKHRLKSTDIFARQRDNGQLKVVRYYSNNLITPMVDDILATGLSGTTCVLTKTNEDALQITGLLLKNKVQAKLIQSNEGFSLYNVQEIRCFINVLNLTDDVFVISEDAWEAAKKEIAYQFRNSHRLDLCMNLIRDFEQSNPKKKYKSDFDTFVRESKLEDFYSENGETVFVSTIHKAKGKEFDNVFIMLDNYNAESDEAKRVLYVGMTRAKRNLTIHLNTYLLDVPSKVLVDRIENKETYLVPNGISLHLSHKDVYLGYFEYVQNRIRNIVSGDALIIKEEGCANSNGDLVLKYSQKTGETLKYHAEKGYRLKEAKVNFIVYWHKEGSEKEIKIILPELYLEKDRKEE